MVILIFLLLLFAIIDYVRHRSIISPGFLFNFIFFVCFSLYEMKMSKIQQDFSSRTIFIFYVMVLTFNAPLLLYNIAFRKTYDYESHYTFTFSKNAQKWLLLIISIVFIIEVIYCKGFPLLWKITGSGGDYMSFGITSINGLLYGMLIFLGSYTLFDKGNLFKWPSMLIALLLISRQMLIAIVLIGFLFWMMRKKSKIKHLGWIVIIFAVVGVAAFSIIGNFRTGEEAFLKVAEFKKEYDWVPTWFKWIYSYVCFSFSNFNNLVSMSDGAVNGGAMTLNGLLPNVISDALNIEYNYDPYYLVKINFNVNTFLPELYLDFGIFGIGVFCFLVGLCSIELYSRALSGSQTSAYCYAVFAHNIIFLFFVNMFIHLPIMVCLLFALIFIKKKTINEVETKNEEIKVLQEA